MLNSIQIFSQNLLLVSQLHPPSKVYPKNQHNEKQDNNHRPKEYKRARPPVLVPDQEHHQEHQHQQDNTEDHHPADSHLAPGGGVVIVRDTFEMRFVVPQGSN